MELERWGTPLSLSHLANVRCLPLALEITTLGVSPFPNETKEEMGAISSNTQPRSPTPDPLIEQCGGTDTSFFDEGAQMLGYALPYPTNHHEWPSR